MLEEEQSDEDRKEERNGKVLIQGPYGGSAGENKRRTNYILVLACFRKISRNSEDVTHADRVTLDAGTTRTRLGRTKTVESQVTTRSPSRNFPGVAPPAPQIQIICRKKKKTTSAKKEYWSKELYIRQTQH